MTLPPLQKGKNKVKIAKRERRGGGEKGRRTGCVKKPHGKKLPVREKKLFYKDVVDMPDANQ